MNSGPDKCGRVFFCTFRQYLDRERYSPIFGKLLGTKRKTLDFNEARSLNPMENADVGRLVIPSAFTGPYFGPLWENVR